MPLSDLMKQQSLDELLALDKINQDKHALITKVNALAADASLVLSYQSDDVKNLFRKHINESEKKLNEDEAAQRIFAVINEQLARESAINRQAYQNQDRFDETPLNKRTLHDQMQDHDVTLLMPKSNHDVEVLGAVDRFDMVSTSLASLKEGIDTALKTERINHLIIPVGPGHWRGLYLSKPAHQGGKFSLEIFDPYGSHGAKALEEFALGILAKSGIKESQIEITLTGPKIPQADGYACGDFVCGHSQEKMKEFGIKNEYNQELIDAYDNCNGNIGDALRKASRKVTEDILAERNILQPKQEAPAPVAPKPVEVKSAEVQKPTEVIPTEVKPPEVKPTEVKPTEVKPTEVKPTEVKPTEVKPTEVKPPEVKPTSTADTSAAKVLPPLTSNKPRSTLLDDLIEQRASIFKRAHLIEKKIAASMREYLGDVHLSEKEALQQYSQLSEEKIGDFVQIANLSDEEVAVVDQKNQLIDKKQSPVGARFKQEYKSFVSSMREQSRKGIDDQEEKPATSFNNNNR